MQSGAGAVFLLAVRGATRASGSVTRCIDGLWLSERRYFLLSRNVPQMMSLEWSKVRGVNAHLNPANTFKIFIQLGSILAVGGGVLVIERSELDEATKRASGIRPVA